MEIKIANEESSNENKLKNLIQNPEVEQENPINVENYSYDDDDYCSYEETSNDELTITSYQSSLSDLTSLQYTDLRSKLNTVNSNKNIDESLCQLQNRMKFMKLNETGLNKRNLRKNMSFSNEEILKIDRDNEFLLRRIMLQQRPNSKKYNSQTEKSKLSSSAINRRRFQQKVQEENMVI